MTELTGPKDPETPKEDSGRGSISRRPLGTEHSSHRSFSAPLPTNLIKPDAEEKPIKKTTQKPPSDDVSLFRVARLNKPEIPILVLGTLVAAANGMIFPLFSILLSSMIKTFYENPHKLRKDSRFWALIFVALASASLVIHPLRAYIFSVAGCKLIQRVRSMCFQKVVFMEVSWFDEVDHSSGAIGARLSADAASLRSLAGDALGMVVQNIATAVTALAIAFATSWQLALIILVLLPFLGVNGYTQVKATKGFSADAKVRIKSPNTKS